MSNHPERPAGAGDPPVPATDYNALEQSPDFVRLRRAFRGFAFPVTVGFVAWYLLYVLLSNYAPGFMGTQVVGTVNMAMVLGLLQFATTFAIAVWYSHYAKHRLDELADGLRDDHDNGRGPGSGRPAPTAPTAGE